MNRRPSLLRRLESRFGAPIVFIPLLLLALLGAVGIGQIIAYLWFGIP
jgi:hypothetical protein